MKRTRRYRWQSPLALIWCFAALLTCADSSRADPPATMPSESTVAVPASIEAFWSADLYAKTSGYVDVVKRDLGDPVEKGNELAILRVPELEASVAHAKATLAAKKQMVAAADAVIAQAQQAVLVAQKQLESYRADYELQQVTYKRQQELSAQSAATPQQLDEARAKAEMSKASVGIGEAKVLAANADLTTAKANREVASAQVDVAEAALREANALQEYTKITAPFAGMITRRQVNPGDLVQAATASRTMPLFTVQQIDTVRIFCDVPELKAAGVEKDAPAEVKVYGLEGKVFTGKVTRLAHSLNPSTRTMRAEIDLDNPGHLLRPGMYAQVTLVLRSVARPATAPSGK